jgi:hypothetical protein
MRIFNPAMGNAVNMANSSPQTASPNNAQQEQDKNSELLALTRIKMKLDVIAVILLIGYLGYSLVLLNKKTNGGK